MAADQELDDKRAHYQPSFVNKKETPVDFISSKVEWGILFSQKAWTS